MKKAKDFWDAIKKADKVHELSIELDVQKLRSDGRAMKPEDYTKEKFEAHFNHQRVSTNAETLRASVSGIYANDRRMDTAIEMVLTDSGFGFEGLGEYALFIASGASDEVLESEGGAEKLRDRIMSDADGVEFVTEAVRKLIWKSTFNPKDTQ